MLVGGCPEYNVRLRNDLEAVDVARVAYMHAAAPLAADVAARGSRRNDCCRHPPHTARCCVVDTAPGASGHWQAHWISATGIAGTATALQVSPELCCCRHSCSTAGTATAAGTATGSLEKCTGVHTTCDMCSHEHTFTWLLPAEQVRRADRERTGCRTRCLTQRQSRGR